MRQGFFNRQLIEDTKPFEARLSCASCGLYRGVLSPRMEPYGGFKLGILNIGEGPGETEDSRNKQWQGRVGSQLKSMYGRNRIDLFEDCLNINSVNCRPPENRKPEDHEISCCHSRVKKVIEENRPKLIMLFGDAAVRSIIGNRWKKQLKTISRWRGYVIPDRYYNCWIGITFHPSFVLRGEEEVATIVNEDMKRALSYLNKPFPKFEDETKFVRIVDNLDFLKNLRSPFAFDFETTGLKPHHPDHEIICMSICDGPDRVFVFRMRSEFVREIRELLESERYHKIAQNMKFEDTWSMVKLGAKVRNWLWDPMLASHVLDNREDTTGLKFQVYVNFGLNDYDSEIEHYLESIDPKNGNSFNRIRELISTKSGLHKLLIYCGLDSFFEFRLSEVQRIGFSFGR
jgi:uracil-DNA glycosylase family 4